MLEKTFCHIPGISARAEHGLWRDGITSWKRFPAEGGPFFSGKKNGNVALHLDESRRRLAGNDSGYFSAALPSREHWRLFSAFAGSIAYLDIETTGLSRDHDAITTIALYDGRTIRHYVQGENLEAFAADIRNYQLLVTYNGKCFDLPFIETALGISLPMAHIDLRYVLASLGMRGGLKGCEREIGLSRGDLDGVDGLFAVRLWHDYRRRGERRTLETLLAYNIEDVINLELLMVHAYNRKLAETPFAAELRIAVPAPARNPFRADPEVLARLRGW
jgi:hypothetical protein